MNLHSHRESNQAAGSAKRDFENIFLEEMEVVRQSREKRGAPAVETPADGASAMVTADRMKLVGLALSGGGIRSATFSLGVLQALAKFGLLRQVDYLSTVSGGGYIGGWLHAMIHRTEGGIAKVEEGLIPEAYQSDSLPQKAIAYLRAFSNYLTPKLGFLSADTWTMASIWLRNTLLNLTILVSGIAALVLIARSVGVALEGATAPNWFLYCSAGLLLWIAAVFLGLCVGRGLPASYRNDKWVQLLVVCPALAATLCLTVLIRDRWTNDILWTGLVISLSFLVFAELARFRSCFCSQHDNPHKRAWGFIIEIAVNFVSGYGTAWFAYGLSTFLKSAVSANQHPWFLLTASPPLILGVLSLGVILNIGLLGRDIPDEIREWAGRLGAWVWIYGLGWLLLFAAAIYGPGAMKAGAVWVRYATSGAWIAATLGSLLGGKSSKTGDAREVRSFGTVCLDLAVRVGPYVFIAGFVILIALGVHELANLAAQPAPSATWAATWEQYWNEMKLLEWFADEWYKGLAVLLTLSAAITILMSWRVDINEFSLHHFYKNRLVRCYMGASREARDRHPDPFTKFDPDDDLPLSKLIDSEFSGPFPIINATLNLSGGRNLAWQERKGASFIFTPLYSGYDTGGDTSGTSVNRKLRVGGDADMKGYWPTRLVAKTETGGIHLGTAVAISGAAANPNQGFHTSTAVGFLMTVFNVRLGWWLGNPTQNHASWSSPAFGLPYLLAELFGTTDARSEFVNLSDGGHFDNMGLYELIRRRCRYIVVCDAEQDQDLSFGGISTAIRMCRTDFGVEVKLDLSLIQRKPRNRFENFSAKHYDVGEIVYPDGITGTLIYVKSSLTGRDEPADVLGYHKVTPLFPHESTADQWFGESQFESYRRLGQAIGETVFAKGWPASENRKNTPIGGVMPA